MSSYIRVALRFWWLLVLGAGLGMLAAIGAAEHISLAVPPKLTARAQPSFTANAQLLVNSRTNPYLRTGVTNVVTKPAKITRAGGGGTSSVPLSIPQAPDVSTQVPDTHPLVQAANFFPLLIESDEVAALREQLYGQLPGSVHAQALFSSSTATKFRPSTLPVITISATAGTPRQAIRLAQATAVSFERWLVQQQTAAHVPTAQRVLIEQLKVPTGAASSGGTKYGLPVFLALAVLAAFAGIAVLLDRLLPGRPRVVRSVEQRDSAADESADGDPPRIEGVRHAARGEATY